IEAVRVAWNGNLEQDAAQLVVDLLVVLVLPFAAESLEHGPEADVDEKLRVEERQVQRDDENGVAVLFLDLDALRLKLGELLLGVGAGWRYRFKVAVDHAVRPVPDHRELV